MTNFVNDENISQKDKEVISKYDIMEPVSRAKYIKKINGYIDLAKKDALNIDVLNDMIKAFGLRIDDYNDALKAEKVKKQHRELVDNAVLSRDKKVLNSVKRAFRNGYLY